jgi:hypothetical protein
MEMLGQAGKFFGERVWLFVVSGKFTRSDCSRANTVSRGFGLSAFKGRAEKVGIAMQRSIPMF